MKKKIAFFALYLAAYQFDWEKAFDNLQENRELFKRWTSFEEANKHNITRATTTGIKGDKQKRNVYGKSKGWKQTAGDGQSRSSDDHMSEQESGDSDSSSHSQPERSSGEEESKEIEPYSKIIGYF